MTQLSETLKRIAKRLQMPQSFILREAIRHYKPYAGQLSTRERKQRIDLFDQLIATIPSRPASETDTELRAQRLSRVGSAGLRPGDDPSRYLWEDRRTAGVSDLALAPRSGCVLRNRTSPEWLAIAHSGLISSTPPVCENRSPKGCTDVSQGWSEATPLERTYMNQRTSKRCEAHLDNLGL